MMTGPTKHELVVATRGWLDAQPTSADGFHRKVAANALGIVERELTQWPAQEALATARLRAILKQDGDFETLSGLLATAIGSGKISAETPEVFEHLKMTALAMLAVDQPRYRHGLSVEI